MTRPGCASCDVVDTAVGRFLVNGDSHGDYLIEVNGKPILFDWSERFGPRAINKDGSEKTSVGPKHPFWRAASLWNIQGRRLEGNRAIWHEPKQPVLRRIAGNHYEVIEDDEPGHDW